MTASDKKKLMTVLLLVLVVLPYIFVQPFWVSAVFYTACLLSVLEIAVKRTPLFAHGGCFGLCRRVPGLPRGVWAGLMALAALAAVLLHWGSFWGRDAGTALFVLLLSAKLVEVRGDKELLLVLLLALFLTYCQTLYFHTLLMGMFIVCQCLLIFVGMVSLQQDRLPAFSAVSSVGRLAVQALPLALLCFVLFPRLPGSLLGISFQEDQAVSGLGTEMAPGMISELALSDSVAFRVEFDGQCPAPGQRYFRALVLRDFDGWTWRQGRLSGENQEQVLRRKGLVHYRIYLEPTYERFLPALDLPLSVPLGATMLPGLVLRSRKQIKQVQSYPLVSSLSCQTSLPGPQEKMRCLQIDPAGNPRTYALVQQLIRGEREPARQLILLVSFFDRPGFSYTLNPPPVSGAHPIDFFLFSSRSGFCEHYAQALAWMSRAAGLPARVVVGYQGGEENPLGGYLIVRQSDAHAWVEVALPDRGWQRVDPVQLVSPARIEQGSIAQTPLLEDDSPLARIWRRAGWSWPFRLGWDALNHNWYRWVIHYTLQRQSRLFTRLHLGTNPWTSLTRIVLVGLAGLFLVVVCVAGTVFGRRAKFRDPVERVYDRFWQRIAQTWSLAPYSLGPLQLQDFLAEKLPVARRESERFVDLLISFKYRPLRAGKAEVREFKRLAHKLMRLCKV